MTSLYREHINYITSLYSIFVENYRQKVLSTTNTIHGKHTTDQLTSGARSLNKSSKILIKIVKGFLPLPDLGVFPPVVLDVILGYLESYLGLMPYFLSKEEPISKLFIK